jgi:hypothetical protein
VPVPAITAKDAPSRTSAIAAIVACWALRIFAPAIEPEQSTMTISSASTGAAADPDPVTVTTASTRVVPTARYGFRSTSTANSGAGVMASSF